MINNPLHGPASDLAERLARLVDALSALEAVSALAPDPAGEAGLARHALSALLEHLPGERADAWLEDRGGLTHLAGVTHDSGLLGETRQAPSRPPPPTALAALEAADDEEPAVTASPGTRPLCVPIASFGTRLGVLCLEAEAADTAPAPFDTLDARTLRLAGRLLGQALANLRQELPGTPAAEPRPGPEPFLYTVAHDLRAPLRGIRGFSQALEEDCAAHLDAAGRDYLTRIRRAADHMHQMLEGLLMLTRVSREELCCRDLNLTALARETAARLSAMDPERTVDWRIAEGLTVIGDERMVRILLDNLLGNAFKFTARQPRARIALGRSQGAGRCALYVTDNGVGFDPAHHDALFQVFACLHQGQGFEGNGVGLATAARIVQRHGGRIWAEGAPGRGATFLFTLCPNGERREPRQEPHRERARLDRAD